MGLHRISARSSTTRMSRNQGNSLTLIVAATKSLGIGSKGQLPWPPLKQEMAYFARVTKRILPGKPEHAHNAVIMGRKTWDSIPDKFRPLKGRVNIVVSRSVSKEATPEKPFDSESPLFCSSLEGALRILDQLSSFESLGRAFIIGGGSMYAEALKLQATKHVLLTRIMKEYDCDTHFPINLDSTEAKTDGWIQKTPEELTDFVGEDMSNPNRTEGDIHYEFCLFEKETVNSG